MGDLEDMRTSSIATGSSSIITCFPATKYQLPTFTQTPDEKYKCVLCKQVLHHPVQTSCGHRMCEACWEEVIRGQTSVPCPANEAGCFQVTQKNIRPDRSARRDLDRLEVFCTNHKSGCDVILPWGKLKDHLEKVCMFSPEGVTSDGGPSLNGAVKNAGHVAHCPPEQRTSGECSTMKAQTGKDKTAPSERSEQNGDTTSGIRPSIKGINTRSSGAHSNERTTYSCTTQSRKMLTEEHVLSEDVLETDRSSTNDEFQVSQQVLLTSLEEIELLKVRMESMSDQSRDVGKTLASVNTKLLALDAKCVIPADRRQVDRHQRELTSLGERQESLARQLESLEKTKKQTSTESVSGTTHTSLTKHARKMAIHEVHLAEVDVRMHTMENTNYSGVLIWKITEFSRRRQEALSGQTPSIYSSPFCTGRYGYRFCARVYLNGDGEGRQTHLSAFFVVMRGEYDALLPWPFRQKVTLTLIDQADGTRHISDSFRPDPTSRSFQRPVNEMNIASGCPLFVSLTSLLRTPYLKDDCIFMKVTVDTSGLHGDI